MKKRVIISRNYSFLVGNNLILVHITYMSNTTTESETASAVVMPWAS